MFDVPILKAGRSLCEHVDRVTWVARTVMNINCKFKWITRLTPRAQYGVITLVGEISTRNHMKPMNFRPFIGAIYLLQVKRPKGGEGRRRENLFGASPVQLLLPWLKFRTFFLGKFHISHDTWMLKSCLNHLFCSPAYGPVECTLDLPPTRYLRYP